MTEEDINRCQIQEWYPNFKSCSIKTIIHELPESFVQYLLDDSGPFLLPLSITNDDALPNRVHKPEEQEDFVTLEGSGDEAEEPVPPPSFPEFEMEIKASIGSLGGAVFPKLNWSAPKDSAWISSTGNLKCTNFSEIALLLRSSDSVVHDLCHAYDSCTDKTASRPSSFFLALRKWYPSLKPEMEFRCFVRHKLLVGICQREVTNFYPALLEKKDDLEMMIEEFFMEKVKGNFGSESYTFDVYVTKDRRVKLLDFNPWGASTLPLMFTWDELEEKLREEGNELEFRIVEGRCGIRPGLKTAVPYDYLDTSQGSGWDQFLRNADEELRRQTSSTEAGA
ncbi:cell division cycle protein 123 homolog [Sesamum indicum]|uniref:Cell division cycle protein 123 homolog n=1 Tax=Sesamum indicum TaxID=4182 RepID=A0A6I9TL11_SESIN|nr:cell division cycle protein 123 homolog [Sesamum indicum]XP_011084998.1 cell division cycle protein 123 homolog [Sesamum indicum]